ncbi:MAG: hypothetical protein HRU41_20530 [Saprospiraceae bacterium]|nr:hypothetical protein [Saprospiraceae bacterium]
MKLHRVLLSLAIAYLLLRVFAPVQEPVMELSPVDMANTCICFEYHYNTADKAERVIFQTCEAAILDQLADPTLEIFTFNLPCEAVFAGTREADTSSIEISVAQVD